MRTAPRLLSRFRRHGAPVALVTCFAFLETLVPPRIAAAAEDSSASESTVTT